MRLLMPDRAVVFIDGNNWYHSIKDAGIEDLGRLDYGKISRKLLGPIAGTQACRRTIGCSRRFATRPAAA